MKKLSENPIIIFLGIVATLLTIYGFLTNRFSIQQVVSGDVVLQEEEPRVATITESGSDTVSDLGDPLVPTPTANHIPIKQYPAATISMSDWTDSPYGGEEGYGKVRAQWLADGKPIDSMVVAVSPVTIDTLGNPVVKTSELYNVTLTDFDGMVEFQTAVGTNALINPAVISGNFALGNWGEPGKNVYLGGDVENISLLIFPVEPNKITDIIVNLSSLEVEVYNEDGSTAIYNEDLFLYCQGTDIAGDIIPSDMCGDIQQLWVYDYPTGVASFLVGPGTFYLTWRRHNELLAARDIVIGPNETKRISIYIPEDKRFK